jgi:hypothetical protein
LTARAKKSGRLQRNSFGLRVIGATRHAESLGKTAISGAAFSSFPDLEKPGDFRVDDLAIGVGQ